MFNASYVPTLHTYLSFLFPCPEEGSLHSPNVCIFTHVQTLRTLASSGVTWRGMCVANVCANIRYDLSEDSSSAVVVAAIVKEM